MKTRIRAKLAALWLRFYLYRESLKAMGDQIGPIEGEDHPIAVFVFTVAIAGAGAYWLVSLLHLGS